MKVFFFYWNFPECDEDACRGVDFVVPPGYWDTFEAASFEDARAAFRLAHPDVFAEVRRQNRSSRGYHAHLLRRRNLHRLLVVK